MTETGQRLTQEDRDALALAATAARRRNRPRSAVLLGGLLLAIGLVVLAWGATSSRAASSRLTEARANLGKMKQMAAELEALRQREQTAESDRFAPIGNLEIRIRDVAQELGIESGSPTRRSESIRGTGIEAVRLEYSVSGTDFEPMLQWVQAVAERIDGMHVKSLDITVRGERWGLAVTFERFEREASS